MPKPPPPAPSWEEYVREIGLRLHRERLRLALSQEQLAHAAGITRSHYQQIEKGRSKPGTPANPSLSTLVGLTTVLGVELRDLLPDTQPADTERHAG